MVGRDGSLFERAVDECSERHGLAQIVFGDILGALQYPIVVVAEQVIALSPGHLAETAEQGDIEHGVRLVTTAFLDLAEAVVIELPDRMFNSTVPGAVLEVVERFIIDVAAISQYADCQYRVHVGQVPVGPVVVGRRAVLMRQEVMVDGIEDVEHQALKLMKVLRSPLRVAAQYFRRVGQLVTVQACGQGFAGVAFDRGEGDGPLVQDTHCFIGIRRVAGDLPAQRQCIGCCGVVEQLAVVIRAA